MSCLIPRAQIPGADVCDRLVLADLGPFAPKSATSVHPERMAGQAPDASVPRTDACGPISCTSSTGRLAHGF